MSGKNCIILVEFLNGSPLPATKFYLTLLGVTPTFLPSLFPRS